MNPRFLAMVKERLIGKNQGNNNLIARDSNIEAMKWLMSQGAEVNAKSRGGMLMHVAALTGSVETMKLLKEQGFDLNAKTDEDDRTPLDFANEMLEELHEELEDLEGDEVVEYSEDILSLEILIKVVIQDVKEGIDWLKANGAVESE